MNALNVSYLHFWILLSKSEISDAFEVCSEVWHDWSEMLKMKKDFFCEMFELDSLIIGGISFYQKPFFIVIQNIRNVKRVSLPKIWTHEKAKPSDMIHFQTFIVHFFFSDSELDLDEVSVIDLVVAVVVVV